MDILKTNSAFMCGIMSRAITKFINKKFGTSLKVFPSDISIEMGPDTTSIHLDVDITIPAEDTVELIKKLNL